MLKPIECPRYKLKNPPGSKFCNRCSMVLDALEAQELDTRLKVAETVQELVNRYIAEHAPEILERALGQPELKEMLPELVRVGWDEHRPFREFKGINQYFAGQN